MSAGIAHIDFETRSPLDLKKVGLWPYSHHAQTGVWCLGVAFDEEPARITHWHECAPLDGPVMRSLVKHIEAGLPVFAHNAQFEYAIWNDILVPRFGLPELKLEQLHCTMAQCYAMGLPGSLEFAAAALGLKVAKDDTGRQLMLRMARPTNPQRLADGLDHHPRWITDDGPFTFMGEEVTPEWAVKRLGEYCKTDVEVERQIHQRAMKLSAHERQVWLLDQRINRRGILFEPEAVKAALQLRDRTKEDLDTKMDEVTGGAVGKTTALIPLKDWLADFGVITDSLNKETLGDILALDLPEPARAALEIRQEAGRATSVAKLDAVARSAGEDGRVRYLFQYHGAHTGRFAGRSIQPHNITRDLPSPEQVEGIMQCIKLRDVQRLDILYGPPFTVISRVLRGFIIAEPGKKLCGGDWASIEGRGLAWLAGEDWKIRAFIESDNDPDGPDIYERSYAATFATPASEVTKDQRQVGKVIELALGYQGGVGAFQQMASSYGVRMPDEEADKAKHAWRNAHPKVKNYWYALERAAINATRQPGTVFVAGAPGRQVKFKKVGSFLLCLLPSRRTLCYPYPLVIERDDGWGPQLTYKTVPSADDIKHGRLIDDPTNTRGWARLGTYGGKLAENITQAVCRDILVDAMLKLEDQGYEVVKHVHDEVIVEGELDEPDRAYVEKVMKTSPPWAEGFPLNASCWLAERYRKE